MGSFRKDKTTVAQTAAQTSATVVAALVNAGIITDVETAKTEFDGIRVATFAELEKVVDSDNELFASIPDSPKGGSGGGYRKNSGGIDYKTPFEGTVEEARALQVPFGKFAKLEGDKKLPGETLGTIENMTGSDTQAFGHGEGDKTGLSYLEWMSKNDGNKYFATAAALILEDRKAASAE